MTEEEKKEDNARKRAREARSREAARARGDYDGPKKRAGGKYPVEFRYPAKYHEKITMAEYKTLMGEVSKRSINAAMAIVQSGETLA